MNYRMMVQIFRSGQTLTTLVGDKLLGKRVGPSSVSEALRDQALTEKDQNRRTG